MKARSMRSRVVGALAAVLVTGGCNAAREMKATLGELLKVREQVAASVPGTDVNVNLVNGRYLDIALVNSPLKALPPDQKEARAREIALVAYRAFPARAKLQQVAVVFWIQRTYLFFFHFSDGTDYHAFSAEALAANGTSTSAQGRGAAGRAFAAARRRGACATVVAGFIMEPC